MIRFMQSKMQGTCEESRHDPFRILRAQTVITDGNWHRVGLTWDGSVRRLYVDDVLVAEDTQSGLQDAFESLLLGCGKDMTPATFWDGLIDDVRIYNRAVSP